MVQTPLLVNLDKSPEVGEHLSKSESRISDRFAYLRVPLDGRTDPSAAMGVRCGL